VDGGIQQPTKSRPKRWDIAGVDGAQGYHDGGGRCRIVSAIEVGEKKRNITKFVVILAAANRRLNTTTNQIRGGGDGGGIGEYARPAGNAGAAVFDRFGGGRVGRGERII